MTEIENLILSKETNALLIYEAMLRAEETEDVQVLVERVKTNLTEEGIEVLLLAESKFGIDFEVEEEELKPSKALNTGKIAEFMRFFDVEVEEGVELETAVEEYVTVKNANEAELRQFRADLKETEMKLKTVDLIEDNRFEEANNSITDESTRLLLEEQIRRQTVLQYNNGRVKIGSGEMDSLVKQEVIKVSLTISSQFAGYLRQDSYRMVFEDNWFFFKEKTANNKELEQEHIKTVTLFLEQILNLNKKVDISILKAEIQANLVQYSHILVKQHYFDEIQQSLSRYTAFLKELDTEQLPQQLLESSSSCSLPDSFIQFRADLISLIKTGYSGEDSIEAILPDYLSAEEVLKAVEVNKTVRIFSSVKFDSKIRTVFSYLIGGEKQELAILLFRELLVEYTADEARLKTKINVYFISEVISSLISLYTLSKQDNSLNSLLVSLKKINSTVIGQLFNRLIKLIFDGFFEVEDFTRAGDPKNKLKFKQTLNNLVTVTENFLSPLGNTSLKEFMVKYVISILFDSVNKKIISVDEFSVKDTEGIIEIAEEFESKVRSKLYCEFGDLSDNLKYKKFKEILIVLDSDLKGIQSLIKESDQVFLDKNELISLVKGIFQKSEKREKFFYFVEEFFSSK